MMKTKYIILLLAAFILSNEGVKSQEAMTLEACRKLALENNKATAVAARNKEKTELTEKAYRANYLPKISASGNYFYSTGEMNKTISGGYLPTFVPNPATGELIPNILTVLPDGNPIFKEYAYFPDMDFALQLNGLFQAGISAEQPIYTGGKITSAHKMSQIANEIADLNQELTHAEIIVKTDEAYWLYVQANEMLKLAMSYRTVLDELLRNVQDAEEIGLKHKNDVLKVQVKVNEAELQIRQAENGINLSRKNLCHIMGISLNSEVILPESFDDLLLVSRDYEGAFSNRPEYSMLEKQIQLKEQQVKLVKSDFLPKIGVRANYGYINGLKLNGDKLIDNASFSALVNVSIPIFQWGEGRNKVRAAQIERDMIRLQRDEITEKMELELDMASDKCDESILEVELTALSLEQAHENMRITGDRYKGGMETLANYLEAQTMWQRACIENINAKNRQRLNQTYYLKAAGVL